MEKENQFFVDSEGKYIGEFSFENPAIPEDAIEVKIRPGHGKDIWDFKRNKWDSFEKIIKNKKIK